MISDLTLLLRIPLRGSYKGLYEPLFSMTTNEYICILASNAKLIIMPNLKNYSGNMVRNKLIIEEHHQVLISG